MHRCHLPRKEVMTVPLRTAKRGMAALRQISAIDSQIGEPGCAVYGLTDKETRIIEEETN